MKITREFRKDKINKSGYAPIRITAHYDGVRVRISPEESAHKDSWDPRFQKVLDTQPYYQRINDKLDTWCKHIRNIIEDAKKLGKTPTEEELKAALHLALNPPQEKTEVDELVDSLLFPNTQEPELEPVSAEDPSSFFNLFERWISYKETTLDKFGKHLSPDTIQSYRASKERFQDYEKKNEMSVTLTGMDLKFYDSFKKYMITDLKQSINTFSKHIGRLKEFLEWCEDEDLPVNRKFRKFGTPEIYDPVEALSEQEVMQIREFDFRTLASIQFIKDEFKEKFKMPMNHLMLAQRLNTLEQMRDVFLMCCYTGMRISDMYTFMPHHIKGNIIIKHGGKTIKHGIIYYIPFFDDYLFKPVELVEKYAGGQDTCMPVNWDINTHLKTIQKLVGITRLNLTTKIGRKTFATLKLYQGVPRHVVMQATGHKTEKSFNAYIGVDTLKVIEVFTKHSAASSLGGQKWGADSQLASA
ncbi:phage integrase SAM-like domain-containing protein [Rufibacter roseus]|uniref:Phage integrase SAM-like domain-containing protein n=1 Tax=Rufibacter roseus TaxID=1567108 RepID=A0ABW2DTI7_9BACT|nr:phage integrase SAM-like domain-containing protein [Rufibacter roseus]